MYNMEIITSEENEVATKNIQKLNLYWMICHPDTKMSNHKERNNSHRENKETQQPTNEGARNNQSHNCIRSHNLGPSGSQKWVLGEDIKAQRTVRKQHRKGAEQYKHAGKPNQ